MTQEAGHTTDVPGWGHGASRRFLSLAAGRAVAQLVGMVWFLVAARLLGPESFGVVATGLAFFAVFAGLGDLGTTRTVVRYVAANERTMWSAYRKALKLRIPGGLIMGGGVATVVSLLPIPVSGTVVLLAGLMATASGVTELAYAALRSVGHIRAELLLLIGERVVFLAIGWMVIAAGGGPLLILGLYFGTNTVSALLAGIAVKRAQPAEVRDAGSMTDREARFTAAGFGLVTVAPRLPSILVAIFATTTAVGAFAVAQRPIEALTLFALSTCAPLLPLIRGRITKGRAAEAAAAATSIASALLVALSPLVAWFVVSPETVLRLLFGADQYVSAALPLQIVAVTSLTWSLRGVGEFVLLAEERARALFALTLSGTILTLVVGVPLVVMYEQTGAAMSVAIAEAFMTVVLLVLVPGLRNRAAVRAYLPAAVVLGVTAGALLPIKNSLTATCAVVACSGAIAAYIAIRRIQGLEESA